MIGTYVVSYCTTAHCYTLRLHIVMRLIDQCRLTVVQRDGDGACRVRVGVQRRAARARAYMIMERQTLLQYYTRRQVLPGLLINDFLSSMENAE